MSYFIRPPWNHCRKDILGSSHKFKGLFEGKIWFNGYS